MKVVVIDDGGPAGAETAARILDHGHDAAVISAAGGVDHFTGEGLSAALEGCSVAAAGVGHPVSLSVVGVERLNEIPGPDQWRLDAFVRAALARTGERRRVFTDSLMPRDRRSCPGALRRRPVCALDLIGPDTAVPQPGFPLPVFGGHHGRA